MIFFFYKNQIEPKMITPSNKVMINVENMKKDSDIEIFTHIVINIVEQKCILSKLKETIVAFIDVRPKR